MKEAINTYTKSLSLNTKQQKTITPEKDTYWSDRLYLIAAVVIQKDLSQKEKLKSSKYKNKHSLLSFFSILPKSILYNKKKEADTFIAVELLSWDQYLQELHIIDHATYCELSFNAIGSSKPL